MHGWSGTASLLNLHEHRKPTASARSKEFLALGEVAPASDANQFNTVSSKL